MNLGPPFENILRHQGQGSRRSSSQYARFLEADTEEFKSYNKRYQEALSVLNTITPGYAADLQQSVDCIAFVDNMASFRGASGLSYRGLVLLSPDPTWDVGIFAEELVHETTHSLLDIISIRQPLLTGVDAFKSTWDAPFRPDKRPLFGNFHALVVVSRLIHLFHGLANSDVESEINWEARALNYSERSITALQSLLRYEHLSPMARLLLDSLVVPTISSTTPAG